MHTDIFVWQCEENYKHAKLQLMHGQCTIMRCNLWNNSGYFTADSERTEAGCWLNNNFTGTSPASHIYLAM